MSKGTRGMAVWLVLGLGLTEFVLGTREARAESARVRVSVFNDARVDRRTLERAEEAAASIYARAGIRVTWMNCGRAVESREEQELCSETASLGHFHMRIRGQAVQGKEAMLGVSYLDEEGEGCQAEVFYEGVVRVVEESGADPGILLGHAIAHEIGHLLLGTNSHSVSGLMRAGWNRSDLAAANRGALTFTDEQGHRMKAKIAGKSAPMLGQGANLAR